MTYLGGERAVPHYNVMGVAKAALESSMRYLASELGEANIRVNAISAGPVRTLSARSITGFTEMETIVAERAPLKRNIDASDVGSAALYLLSPWRIGHRDDPVRRRRLPRDGYVRVVTGRTTAGDAGRSDHRRALPDRRARRGGRGSRWSSIRCRRARSPRRCIGTVARTSTASCSRAASGAVLGDEVVYAEPGDLVCKPRGQWHTFWNAGDGPARILEIISPRGSSGSSASWPISRRARSRQMQPPWWRSARATAASSTPRACRSCSADHRLTFG